MAALTYIIYIRRRGERQDLKLYTDKTIDDLVNKVKWRVAEIVKVDDLVIASDEKYEAIISNKRRINQALTDAVYGIDSAKEIVIAVIKDVLRNVLPKDKDIIEILVSKTIETVFE